MGILKKLFKNNDNVSETPLYSVLSEAKMAYMGVCGDLTPDDVLDDIIRETHEDCMGFSGKEGIDEYEN